jgi:branched-chain amino acid transport system ATP-binding protein
LSQILLDVKNIGINFGGLAAVSDLSFQVKTGDVLGLIGPNGAGKSTTFNLISGFYKSSTGQVFYQGVEVTNRPPEYLHRLGVVRTFQSNVLFDSMTVFDNLYLGTLMSKGKKAEKMEWIDNILHFLNLYEVRDELSKNLSHGQQRMLGIGIALATKPKLMMLDEPLTGMNPVEIDRAVEILRKINEEMKITMVIVEHNMRAVMALCHRIVVLNYGRKLFEGTPEEVRNNEDVIRAYLGSAVKTNS